MKKFFILLAILLLPSAYSSCPIENGATVCTLPEFREQITPIYNPKSNINEFSGSPEARLNPIDHNEIQKELKRFTPGETGYAYNSSCQFGVCLQNRSTPLFQQPKQ